MFRWRPKAELYPARTLISPVNRQNVVHLRRLGQNTGIGEVVG